MESPTITIIVPVYNVELYIRECFDSIAAQTYKGGIECIFVDDCGQDNSVAILEQMIADYKGKIQFSLIHHEKNKGLSGARNTGIRHATGDYLYFLDSDDTITPDCIERLEALAEKYQGVEVVQGSTNTSNEWLRLDSGQIPEYSSSFSWIRKTLLRRSVIPMTAWNKLVRRDFVIDRGLLFEEGLIHEDEVWNFMLAKHVRSMAFCCDATYNYRENPDGITGKLVEYNYAPVLEVMADRASNPFLSSEIKCMFSLSLEKYSDILVRLYRFKGVKSYLRVTDRVCGTAKFSPRGFFYRVWLRVVRWYVDHVN